MTNPLRDQMMKDIIAHHHGEPITIEHLAQYLPDDFQLGDDDLQQYQRAEAGHAIEFEAGPESAPQAEAIATTQAESANDAKPAPSDLVAIETATVRRLDADKSLANARVVLISAQNSERDARAKLSAAVTAFQSGFAPITPEQLRRQHVHEQAAIRGAIARGEMAGRQRPSYGKSRVDASAYYQRGGSPGGGGRAYSRGAFPASARGRIVAPKVASER